MATMLCDGMQLETTAGYGISRNDAKHDASEDFKDLAEMSQNLSTILGRDSDVVQICSCKE